MGNVQAVQAVEFKAGVLRLIDQRVLPREYTVFECDSYEKCEFAIRDMVVRGAPAIGAAAAYGVVLAAQQFAGGSLSRAPEVGAESEFKVGSKSGSGDESMPGGEPEDFFQKMEEAMEVLSRSRPTAVNLMWAIRRMRGKLRTLRSDAPKEIAPAKIAPKEIVRILKEEADLVLSESIAQSESIAEHGNSLVPEGSVILTHCNTGALAVPGPGTALGVIRAAHHAGKNIFVYADETRPRLQGARLTAWELKEEGIPAKLIADSVAATLLRDGKIDLVVVGADRIAANGDTANKIGTFMLSVIARHYGVPFYIAAPVSTIDFDCPDGSGIEIEERSAEELTHIEGVQVAPEGMDVYNPAFDVTPAEHITAIITEQGVLTPPYRESIAGLPGGLR